MADDHSKTAYIRSEREENSVKYIAKVFNQPPRPITKAQYNAIVKALRAYNWALSTEDETSVISQIIGSNLAAAAAEPEKS